MITSTTDYGKRIDLYDNGTAFFRYGHLDSFAPGLTNGAYVNQHQLIGYMGFTGDVQPGPGNDGSHLHFERRLDPNLGAYSLWTNAAQCYEYVSAGQAINHDFGLPRLWQPWAGIGQPSGGTTSAPDAVSMTAGRIDVFAKGSSSNLVQWRYLNSGSTWSPSPAAGSPSGGLVSGPGATAWGGNRMEVVGLDGSNRLRHVRWNGSAWSSWDPALQSPPGGISAGIAPDMSSSPATGGRFDIYLRGADNQLWHRWWQNGTWGAWDTPGGQMNAAPTGVSWGLGRYDVFVRGSDMKLYHSYFPSPQNSWSAWEDLGGTLASGPEASSSGYDKIDIFAKGSDNGLYMIRWQGGFWHPWEAVGGTITSDPGAVSSTNGYVDVYARGVNSSDVWHRSCGGC